MRKLLSAAIVAVFLAFVACGGVDKAEVATPQPVMQSSADSMSYVMGMNIGLNLIGVDSMLNIDIVCQGIADSYIGESKLDAEEARTAFLKYMNYDNYERVKGIETQFLADLRKNDRKFVATNSGLTYKIAELGNIKSSVRSTRDTVKINMRVLNVAGDIVDSTFYRADTLRIGVGSMPRGVQEATRLIGEGGHIEAWLPSQLAFGAEGCDTLNVKPNTMLYYEIKLIDVERR